MVPTRNLLHHDKKNNNSYYPQYCITTQLEASAAAHRDHKPSRFPRLAMSDDNAERRWRQGDEAAGTSSRGGGGGGDDKDWLQLGLATASSSSTSSSGDNNSTAPAPPTSLELDLFADKQSTRMMRPPLFPVPIRSCPYSDGRYRPTTASGSMSAPFLRFARPLRSSGDLMMRVISPPRRTEAAGLWLTLQAAPNQVREPILPQIPKSYLRINFRLKKPFKEATSKSPLEKPSCIFWLPKKLKPKGTKGKKNRDSNMKVEVVMKYLANKLGLTQSHQVELTCRGQLLPPFLLVKYVRDSIWCSTPATNEVEEALVELPARRSPATTATDHVMTLFYSTSRNH